MGLSASVDMSGLEGMANAIDTTGKNFRVGIICAAEALRLVESMDKVLHTAITTMSTVTDLTFLIMTIFIILIAIGLFIYVELGLPANNEGARLLPPRPDGAAADPFLLVKLLIFFGFLAGTIALASPLPTSVFPPVALFGTLLCYALFRWLLEKHQNGQSGCVVAAALIISFLEIGLGLFVIVGPYSKLRSILSGINTSRVKFYSDYYGNATRLNNTRCGTALY